MGGRDPSESVRGRETRGGSRERGGEEVGMGL